MNSESDIRLDKWLWAVRLYKSRTLAAEACRAGHVQINGQPAKPSRDVKIGDLICAVTGDIRRTLRVTALLERRVAAKMVSTYCEDLTPPAELLKPKEQHYPVSGLRPRGAGRPTKKDRRQIEVLLENQ